MNLLVGHWFRVLIKERQMHPATAELSRLASRLKAIRILVSNKI